MAASHRNRLKKLETLHRPKCNGNHFFALSLTSGEPEPPIDQQCATCGRELFVVKVWHEPELTG